jgi:phosphohistidine phosphatase
MGGDACRFSTNIREVGDNRSTMAGDKRLFLLRHAKSSWDDPALDDFDRPLAARGRKASKLIGEYLRREQVQISLVLCSSAVRARETLDLVAASGEIQIERELYGASADQLLERVRHVPDEVAAVMLIGHNPAIHELALSLLGSPSDLAARKFPTGALAALTFTGPWRALEPRHAELAAFITPRNLG